jgi:hypothetical protein
VRRPGSHSDDLEARLRAMRPEPRPEFLNALADRLEAAADRPERTRSNRSLRVSVAVGLAIVGLAMFGAFGGIGYAASAAHSFASAIVSNAGNPTGGSSPSAAEDQYGAKTTICHHTHSKTNPWVVITVSNNALPAHKAHGDTLLGAGGTCPGPPIG